MNLKVAAIQLSVEFNKRGKNFQKALPLIESAARDGAKLICLPEFFPSGYIFSEEVWKTAETSDGETVQWLKHHAARLGVTIGTSFLEAVADGFQNTFVLMGPKGEYGRVYKEAVASNEKFFNHSVQNSHTINTPFGRIGVGICFENFKPFLPELLIRNDVDLLLQPYHCPSVPLIFPTKTRRETYRIIRNIGSFYAKNLGIPTVMVNVCGSRKSPVPLISPRPIIFKYSGLSSINDSDGKCIARLGREEGYIIGTVTLDSTRKTKKPFNIDEKWVIKLPSPLRWFYNITDGLGGIAYSINKRRKQIAGKILSRGRR